ncbi:MAG: succinyldiaminopimelate transaminase [Chromatiales bacterium]|nr:succinyldiaminopimelate transaminase [Chromatiales bacterium]
MNPALDRLQPYPFERLRALFAGARPPAELAPIRLSIGEPQHPTPTAILAAFGQALTGIAHYPVTRGEPALRETCAAWASRRFGLSRALDPEREVLPVNGTREALFAIAQTLVDVRARPLVAMPNPFYQIYEGAALLAGGTPYLLPNDGAGRVDLAAVPAAVWDRVSLVYLCSPANPAGHVLSLAQLTPALDLADRHGFVVCADECYSEIYPDEAVPPPGLLAACARSGRDGYERALVFHSLSKRSNAPGLRSGFVAGDAKLIEAFHRYRTYHGCAMPPPQQAASIAAWNDEAHVVGNRAMYRAKFAAVLDALGGCLDVGLPEGGFYLWPRTPVDDERFARELYAQKHVSVLPGRYLSRPIDGADPGAGRVRIALVAPIDECVSAAKRIREFVHSL